VISAVQNPHITIGRQLTDAEKLRKVISELVDTEKSYIKVLFSLNILYDDTKIYISHTILNYLGTLQNT